MERYLSGSVKEDGECCGVTFNECHILLEMADTKEIAMTDLSRKLGMDKSVISRTVDELVRSGMIRREEHASDRRRKSLVLTEGGKGAARSIDNAMNDKYRGFFSALDEAESEKVLDSMTYLASVFNRLISEGIDCCGGRS